MKNSSSKKIKASLLTGSLVLAMGFLAHAQTLTVNFDSDTVGAAPVYPNASDWTIVDQAAATPGTVLVDNTESVSPPNSLQLQTFGQYVSGPDVALLLGQSAYMPYTTLDQVSLNIRFTSVSDQQTRLQMVDSSGAGVQQLKFNDGTLIAQSGTGFTPNTVASYAANTWYTVIMTTTPSSGLYGVALYQGSTLLGSLSGLADTNGGASQVDGVNILSDGSLAASSLTQSTFVDNLVMGSVPEPSAIALVSASVLGLAALRRQRRS